MTSNETLMPIGDFSESEVLRFNPEEAAVVVVDVQNDFMHPDGAKGKSGRDVSRVAHVVENLKTFLPVARANNVQVVFVRNVHSEDTDTWQWLSRRNPNEAGKTCRRGTWGAEWFGIEPDPEDIVIEKSRYSAFASPENAAAFRQLGRTSLLFAGVATSVCVESSLRDAVFADFLGTLLTDCCGDFERSAHEASENVIAAAFGLVTESSRVVEYWNDLASASVGATRARGDIDVDG